MHMVDPEQTRNQRTSNGRKSIRVCHLIRNCKSEPNHSSVLSHYILRPDVSKGMWHYGYFSPFFVGIDCRYSASLASQQRQTESYEDQLEDDELYVSSYILSLLALTNRPRNIISSVLPLAINQGRDIKTDKSRPRSDVEPLSTGNSVRCISDPLTSLTIHCRAKLPCPLAPGALCWGWTSKPSRTFLAPGPLVFQLAVDTQPADKTIFKTPIRSNSKRLPNLVVK